MRTGTTSRSAIAPTMPHMDGELLLGTDDCKRRAATGLAGAPHGRDGSPAKPSRPWGAPTRTWNHGESVRADAAGVRADGVRGRESTLDQRSEEHTSEIQSLMRNSYAVFCLKKKKQQI